MRIRMEGSQSKNHEDHIAGKGVNSLSFYNLVHKLFPCLKPWKCQKQRQQWRKNCKIGELTGMAADESQEQKCGDRWSKDQGPYCSFFVIDGVGAEVSNVQRQSCAPRWHCKGWFRFMRSIHWTRIISITNDSRKSHGHYFKTTGMRRTSSRRSICWYPGQNGRWNQNVQICGYVYQNTSGLNHGPVWKIQSSLSKGISTVILYNRTILGRAIGEHPFEKRLGESSKLGMFVRWQRERIILVCVCGRNQKGGKDTKSGPFVENTFERRCFGRTNINPWPCLFRLHSTRMQNNKENVDNFRAMFESRMSIGGIEHFHYSEKSEVMQRDAWKDIANLRINRLNNYTKSRPHERMTTMRSNCSEISVLCWKW